MPSHNRLSRLHEATPPAGDYDQEGHEVPSDFLPPAANVIPLAVFLVVAALLIAAAAMRALPSRPATAAIVDQLSLTSPSPDFVQSATDTLQEAGYNVDYYSGDEVSVDLYRDLQTKGYEFLVFRAHSSRLVGEWRGNFYNHAVLWTSEPYDPARYVREQRELRLALVSAYEGGPEWFAIDPGFVVSDMRGNFNGTTIILMGCNGLATDKTGEVFLLRGAEAVIGWDGDVSTHDTDKATARLLELMALDGLAPEVAVGQVKTEVGSDPTFGGALRVLADAGERR